MSSINLMTNDIDNIGKQWVVYYILDGLTAEVKFAGLCLFSQLHAIPDARSNAIFRQNFPVGRPAILQATQFFQTKTEALPVYYKMLRDYNLSHMMATSRIMKTAPILCNETGEVFQTIMEASIKKGIAASALSNHLNNKPGFRTVKNHTYSRVAA